MQKNTKYKLKTFVVINNFHFVHFRKRLLHMIWKNQKIKEENQLCIVSLGKSKILLSNSFSFKTLKTLSLN